MKINIEWQAHYEDCGTAGCSGVEEQRLLVSTDEGHDLMYVRTDHIIDDTTGPNLNDPAEVLSMVLQDLGFEVKSNR